MSDAFVPGTGTLRVEGLPRRPRRPADPPPVHA